MLAMPQTHRERALLLATGQVTSYGSGTGVDDGALKKGIVKAYTILTAGQYAGTTNITINSKTDAHSNNCVEDNNTGLMWSRYVSASVGPASNGLLPWTTTGSGATAEGIFPYVAAANAAALAGYSDWRIPNDTELMSLRKVLAANAAPDSTAFPSWPLDIVWTSTTTSSSLTANANRAAFSNSTLAGSVKTTNWYCALVRGGR